MGLRPARRRAEGQHQAAVVEVHGHPARRRRRPGLLDHPAARDLGRVRPRRDVQRPARRVPVVPQAVPRRPPPGGRRREARQDRRRGRPRHDPAHRDRVHQLRHPRPVDRAAPVLRPAQDVPRRRRGRVGPALPAARDRAGHLPQLPQRHELVAPQAAVRHRPDRQVVPQRDHARQLHLPHARVRADGDGVLRQARRGRGVAPAVDRRPHRLVRRPRHQPGEPAPLRAPQGEALPLLEADRRHRVPVQLHRLGVGRARGHRQPHRLRPHHALAALRAPSWSTSTRRRGSATRPTSSSRRPACRAR